MPSDRADVEATPLRSGMSALLWVAAVLVFLAGVQLFVFTERTDRYFAWTIDPPLTAAFLGASYWSAVAFEVRAARARHWAHARIAVPAVFVFTTLTLVVTLVHIENFHFGAGFETGTRAVTWAWLAVYAVVPLLMIWITVTQLRGGSTDPPRGAVLPRWLTVVVAVQAVGFLVLGAALLVAPLDAAELWPWPLSALTGRAVGAWVLSLGVAAAHALRERDLHRLAPAAVAYLVFGALQAVALARYPDTVDWGAPETIVYIGVLGSTVVTGGAVLRTVISGRGAVSRAGIRAAGTGSST